MERNELKCKIRPPYLMFFCGDKSTVPAGMLQYYRMWQKLMKSKQREGRKNLYCTRLLIQCDIFFGMLNATYFLVLRQWREKVR